MAHAIYDQDNRIRYIILPCNDEDGSEEEIRLIATLEAEDGQPHPTHMISAADLTSALRNNGLIPA